MLATGPMRALALCLLALAAAIGSTSLAEAQTLTADGTEFVLTLEDGRVLRSADLVGATLMISSGGREMPVRIASVEEDAEAVGGRVLLHRLLVKDEAGLESSLCTPDARGRSLGFPVPDGKGGFELTCTSGAVGKCIRWGYRFWEEKPGGPPLRALHTSCIRMTRADYGGDSRTFTRDGTMIFFCDRFGVVPCEDDAPMEFEAAWGVDGAICVAHPRIAELTSLERLAERYPRLANHLGAAHCSLEGAMQDSAALLFNRSKE